MSTTHAVGDAGTSAAVRWSALGVGGKQALQLAFGLALARLLGPQAYGVVGAATIFVTLSILLLDQGLSAALIQRTALTPRMPGAAMSLNLASGVVLGLLTLLLAPAAADFLNTPELAGVLRLLALGLLLKAAAIAPRALASRALRFRPLAVADLSGAAVGAAGGLAAALLGAGYHALVVQILLSDLVVLVVLLRATRGPWPNLAARELRPLLPFGLRLFATNSVAYSTRNVDNVLVGRYLGTVDLAFYSMAYRVLVLPVQLVGQSVNRVLFPVLSRIADDRARVGATLLRALELLSLVAFPAMALVACAAPELVVLGLGEDWLPTAPLITVLALAGARETVVYTTPALISALGRARLNLRFQLVSSGVQVVGIVCGVPFGVLGVAVGYAVAGCVLTPVSLVLQRSLAGVPVRRQLRAVWPAVHASAWAGAGYLLVRRTGLDDLPVLLLGAATYTAVLLLVLRVAHPAVLDRVLRQLRRRAGALPGAAP
ncbi:MAG TPA: lipopolysaccharide biosynthesis protein [Mycobacteriales bacterium]|jgi:PST family polysaccharide transporter|nr:lipopolysaccharide biosynthesis protein [Mycobacteriales bacterium]